MTTISLVDQDIFTAIRTFLLTIVPSGIEVVQEQDNQVAMPKGGFVGMNNTQVVRLATNVDTYNPLLGTGTKYVETAFRYMMQLDFYGPDSQSWAAMTSSLWRDEYATDLFPVNIQPLYADDPQQMVLIDGEEQYEQRWRVQSALQYNPVITLGQDFATSLSVQLVEVDATYPPN
jgi:hypothetical protein